MSRIAEVAARLYIRTAPFSIIRLYSRDLAKIEEEPGGMWDRTVELKEEGLKPTMEIVKENVTTGLDTYAKVNNQYEGCAPLSIWRLLDILEEDAPK